jgi:Outer membrane efflux protein.
MSSDVALNIEKQGLMLRTAQAYFSVLAAQDSLEYTNANEKALQRQLDETQQRFEVGMTAITDVQEAKAAHDLARGRQH